MSNLRLERLEEKEVGFIAKWLKQDYVQKWFPEVDQWLNEVLNRETKYSYMNHFVVYDDQTPIGFCQYYDCTQGKQGLYGNTDLEGAYSLDYLIGEQDHLGKGLGEKIIFLLTEKVFSLPQAKVILLKPEEDNLPSCKAIKANGYLFNDTHKFFYKTKPN